MTKIVPNDLLQPTEKTIKNWNCSFIAVDGPNIKDKLSLEDLEIPYESQYRSRIVLHAGEINQPLIYGFIGRAVTFLMVKVTYDSVNDPYYKYEQENYNITYYFEGDPTLRPLGRLMIQTGSAENRIPQIYLNNSLDYDVVLDVLHATIDTEYDNSGTTVYHPQFTITNITTAYTGSTDDQYIRCSGTTVSGSTYTLVLPNATGSGNLLIIKNIDQGIITIVPQESQTIDYGLTPITLTSNQVAKLIDGSVDNWDNLT
jgi:hypothetical protein